MSVQLILVPKLRFREFKSEWQRRELSEVAEIQRGRFSPRPRNDPRFYGGDVPFVQTRDVVKSAGRISTYTQTLNEEGVKVSKVFPTGTILITIAANIGYTGVLQMPMACPDSLVGISVNSETHNTFLDYVLQIQQPRMDYLAVEAAQKNINIGFLEPYVITTTTLPEQKKVSAFLTSVDQRTEQLRRKRTLLQEYKKGVMQRVFTQTVRFKDENGNNFPDWEEKKLGDIATFSKGKGISKNDVSEDGATKCIRYGELYTIYSETISTVYSSTSVPTSELVISQANDVIIPASGETHIDIATASCVMNEGIALGGDLNIIRSDVNGVFLAYFLNNAMKHRIAGLAQGSSVIHLYASQLKDLKLQIPTKGEQTKIAKFLSEIDTKIEQVTDQITHTQTFKKGLLQQMFV